MKSWVEESPHRLNDVRSRAAERRPRSGDGVWIALPCLIPPLLFAAGRGQLPWDSAPGRHPLFATLQILFLLAVAGYLVGAILRPSPALQPPPRGRGARGLDYLRLTKPALNALVLAAVWIGFFLASPGPLNPARLLCTLLGSALLAGAASALNQVIERVPDCRMPRTEARPLPAGRLTPRQGLRFAVLLALAGMGLLASAVNLATAFGATFSFAVYIWVYTPLKRVSTLATLAGAVSGAMPPLLGWFGAGGRLTPAALVLFFILYLWQIPHFLAIAWKYREQYRDAGFCLFGVLDPTGRATGLLALLYTAALLPVSLMMTWQGLAGQPYLVGAFVMGMALLGFSALFALDPAPRPTRRLFIATVGYLPLLFLMMVLDSMIQH